MNRMWLLPLALPLLAAGPNRTTLSLNVTNGDAAGLAALGSAPAGALASPPRSSFEPAPLPNRALRAPATPIARQEPTLAPTLFSPRTQYRGDGFSPGSTAQGEQEHRLRPAAGFSLHMPLQPE